MAEELSLRVRLSLKENAQPGLRKITSTSGEAAKAISQARKQLGELVATRQQIESFRALQEQSKSLSQEIGAARESMKGLKAQAASADQALGKLAAQERSAAEGLGKLTEAEKSLRAARDKAASDLRTLSASYDKNMQSIRGYQEQIGAGRPLSAAQKKDYQDLIAAQARLRNEEVDLKLAVASTREAHRTAKAAVNQSTTAHKTLTEQVKVAAGAAKEAGRAQDQAKAAVDRLSRAHGAQQQQLQASSARLREAGVSVSALGAHELRLKRDIESATSAIRKQQDELKALAAREREMQALKSRAREAQGTAGSVAAGGAGAAIAGAGAASGVIGMVKSYASLEEAMLGVAKQVEGARDGSGKLTRVYFDMKAGIEQLATRIPMATNEIAALVEAGARNGIKGKENLLEFARVTAVTADAFGMLPEVAGDSMSRLSNLYKIPIKDIERLGDTINYLDDQSLAKGGDIIEVMSRISGQATSMGINFRQAAALGSSFLSLGSAPEVAANSANALIRQLALVEDKNEGLVALGLKAADVRKGMANDAIGTITQVMGKLRGLGKEQRMMASVELFGKEYGDDILKLAMNAEELTKQLAMASSAGAQGSMAREAEARLQGINAQWTLTQNAVTKLKSDLGSELKGSALGVMESLRTGLASASAWIKANPETAAGIMKIVFWGGVLAATLGGLAVAVAGVLGPMILMRLMLGQASIMFGGAAGKVGMLGRAIGMIRGIASMAGGAFGLLGKGLGVLRTGFNVAAFGARLLAGALIANPIGAAIAAVAGLGYLVYSNWESVKGAISGGLAWLQGISLAPVADGAARAASLVYDAWSGMKSVVAGVSFASIADGARNAAAGVSAAWAGMGAAIATGWASLLSMAQGLAGQFMSAGQNIMRGLVDGILSGIAAARQAVTSAGAAVAAAFKQALGIKSPSRVFAALGGDTMDGLRVGLERGRSPALESLTETARQAAAVMSGQPPLPLPGLAKPAASAKPQRSAMVPVLAAAISAAPAMAPAAAAVQVQQQAATAMPAAVAQQPIRSAATQPFRVAQPAAPVARAPAQVSVAGDQITIQITGGAGASAPELAKEIERVLDRRERAKAARIRSSLRDQE